MKILHIITGLGDGGAEHTLFKICKYDNINEHIVISLKSGGKYHSLMKQRGIKIYSLNFNFFSFIYYFIKLIRIIRFLKPELVQTWLVHGDFVGGFASKFAGVKNIVWNIRYSNFETDKTKLITIFLIKLLAKLSYKLPRSIVVVSKKAKETCEKNGYDKKKLVLIQNGYDLSILRPIKNQRSTLIKNLKIKKDLPVIGHIARFDPKKDHLTLLKSLKILHSRNINFISVLVGSNINKNNEELIHNIKKLNLINHVKLLGSKENISKFMSAIDICVQSSKYGEGFPNVIAEAMACGSPCVVTDVGDAALIVGKNGIVVPPNNPERLANAIEQMILKKDSKNWKKIIHQSRLKIKQNFGMNKMLLSYNSLWNRLHIKNTGLFQYNSKNIEVVYVIPRPDGGGAELIVRKLNFLLKGKKFNIKTIYFHNPNKAKLRQNEYSLNLFGPKDIRAIWYLRKLLKNYSQNRLIFVHAHLTWPLYFLVFATYGMKIKLFYTEHNTFNRRRKYFFLKPIERYVYSKYDKIINVSHGVKNSLNDWLKSKILLKKSEVIYNGSRLFDINIRKKINSKKLKLVSIGSLTDQKGFDISIKAVALLKDNVENYTIVGEGEEKRKLEILAHKLGIREKVKFAGYQKNIKPYLYKADLGLLPSRWEGFGLVAIEMLSSGLPLVSSNVYGHKEVIKNCNAVKSVFPENSKKLAQGIIDHVKYIQDIGAKKISQEAKKKSRDFTYKSMIEDYTDLYKRAHQKLITNQRWY